MRGLVVYGMLSGPAEDLNHKLGPATRHQKSRWRHAMQEEGSWSKRSSRRHVGSVECQQGHGRTILCWKYSSPDV